MPIDSPKPAMASMTILACLTVVVTGLVDVVWMIFFEDGVPDKQHAISALVAVLSGVVGIVGRLRAERPIGGVIRPTNRGADDDQWPVV